MARWDGGNIARARLLPQDARVSLQIYPPNGRAAVKPETIGRPIKVSRRDRLGGLLQEYERAA